MQHPHDPLATRKSVQNTLRPMYMQAVSLLSGHHHPPAIIMRRSRGGQRGGGHATSVRIPHGQSATGARTGHYGLVEGRRGRSGGAAPSPPSQERWMGARCVPCTCTTNCRGSHATAAAAAAALVQGEAERLLEQLPPVRLHRLRWWERRWRRWRWWRRRWRR